MRGAEPQSNGLRGEALRNEELRTSGTFLVTEGFWGLLAALTHGPRGQSPDVSPLPVFWTPSPSGPCPPHCLKRHKYAGVPSVHLPAPQRTCGVPHHPSYYTCFWSRPVPRMRCPWVPAPADSFEQVSFSLAFRLHLGLWQLSPFGLPTLGIHPWAQASSPRPSQGQRASVPHSSSSVVNGSGSFCGSSPQGLGLCRERNEPLLFPPKVSGWGCSRHHPPLSELLSYHQAGFLLALPCGRAAASWAHLGTGGRAGVPSDS